MCNWPRKNSDFYHYLNCLNSWTLGNNQALDEWSKFDLEKWELISTIQNFFICYFGQHFGHNTLLNFSVISPPSLYSLSIRKGKKISLPLVLILPRKKRRKIERKIKFFSLNVLLILILFCCHICLGTFE